jgi:hypothetical protein
MNRRRIRTRCASLARVRARVALGSVCLCALASCFGPAHAPEALTRTGFRSPRQTFDTFFAAFEYDLRGLELRCLSADFRRRNQVSELTWREFRDRLEREHPLLRLAARVEVLEERPEGSKTHWIVARAAGTTLRLRFVREDFYEIYSGGERVADGRPSAEPPWSYDPASGEFAVRANVDPDGIVSGPATLNAASISEFRIGYEWKLDDFYEESAPRP